MATSGDVMGVWGKAAIIHAGSRNNSFLMHVSLLALVKTSMSRHVCITKLKMKQTGDPTTQVCCPCCWKSSTCTQRRYDWYWKRNESGKIDPHRKETELSLCQSSPPQAGNISSQAYVFCADTRPYRYHCLFHPNPCCCRTLNTIGCGIFFFIYLTADVTATQNYSHSSVQCSLELENMLTSRH